ncbi:PREDICTED: uncharacterized protein LOC106819085 [Priapulus caudatus]|uniref:Uncharacterized protein LOC106819085 n=1 Tax=Priapulus caudatus TaxID=37621 RepID=A0ABM1F460_PRICU|nr:PREDICTED: uncharacterized protein LOC106819085 [Priapulus caudatus]
MGTGSRELISAHSPPVMCELQPQECHSWRKLKSRRLSLSRLRHAATSARTRPTADTTAHTSDVQESQPSTSERPGTDLEEEQWPRDPMNDTVEINVTWLNCAREEVY